MEFQLRECLMKHNIIPDILSGFKPNHTCATVLLNVTDDIIRAHDEGKYSILVLLDFCKAFDTIQHSLLLSILYFGGLQESTIQLIHSYLCGRSQCVVLPHCVSETCNVTCGVPQGFIFGPLQFSVYASHLSSYLKHLTFHLYADDTQLYGSFHSADVKQVDKHHK